MLAVAVDSLNYEYWWSCATVSEAFRTGTVLKHSKFSTGTAVCVTQLSLVLFFEYYITTVHEAVHEPDAAVHGPCSIAAKFSSIRIQLYNTLLLLTSVIV